VAIWAGQCQTSFCKKRTLTTACLTCLTGLPAVHISLLLNIYIRLLRGESGNNGLRQVNCSDAWFNYENINEQYFKTQYSCLLCEEKVMLWCSYQSVQTLTLSMHCNQSPLVQCCGSQPGLMYTFVHVVTRGNLEGGTKTRWLFIFQSSKLFWICFASPHCVFEISQHTVAACL